MAILAVIAAPKFIGLTEDARRNILKNLGGSIASGVAMTRAKHMINPTDTVEVDGKVITFIEGYPASNLKTVNAFMDIDTPDSYVPYWREKDVPCQLKFCIVGALSASTIAENDILVPEGFDTGTITLIWLQGQVLQSCFAYYYNSGDESKPSKAGSILEAC